MDKKIIRRERLTGERALFAAENILAEDCTFADGESPLKESRDVELVGCLFKWKYPIWYAKNVDVMGSVWYEMARAGVWYSDDVSLVNCQIEAPKNFRRCKRLSMKDVSFSNALETLWHCDSVSLENVTAKGDYFAMDSENLNVKNLTLYGNYSFDGVRNAELSGCRLITKDAFWNSENVTVRDSFISGEYLGWNAKNLTLINCTIESLQGLCYIDNLVMRGCKLLDTTLAFEYSTLDVELDGSVDSVLNPTSGRIVADSIGELTLERDKINPDKTKIILRDAH